MDKLYELKDRLIDEIKEYADIGKLTKDDALTLKALTGSADHLCNLIDKDEYSNRWSSSRYEKGRYSRHGLSDKLRDLMNEAPDDRTRDEIRRLIDKM